MSHARSTFPYNDDREVVASFLSGRRSPRVSNASPLRTQGGTLTWGGGTETPTSPGTTVAWFNPTDNALMGKLMSGPAYHPGVLLIHAITDALGAPELRVTYDRAPDVAAPFRHFFAGTPIQVDQPFLIVGPMAITAYRAAAKSKPKQPRR